MTPQQTPGRQAGPRRRATFLMRVWQLTVSLSLLILAVAPVSAAPVHDDFAGSASKISEDVLQDTADGQSTSFIIYLEDQADVSAAYSMEDPDARGWYVYNTLTQHAAATQAPLIDLLASEGVTYASFWAANMIIAEGDRSLVEAIAARPDIKVIESNDVTDWIQDGEEPDSPDSTDPPDSPDSPEAVDATTPGVNNVNAPQLWSLGYTGQGIVVANQDTGMRWTHTALIGKYRGWNGSSADHNYNWHDSVHARITNADGGTGSPANNSCGYNVTAPCDDQGHGTHTTGTIVGDGGPGTPTSPNQIGVAPGAKWIGCRNMDAGNGRPATYTECFQFFIAPTDLNGQNPDPTRRPHVINNSWGCPPSELCAANTLKTIVENTQAAGIFVVVSAGNDGPNCSTVQDPPAIYDVAFSVGAINGNTNALTSFSSRGPVTVDGSGRMKPNVVAPGQTVRSSLRNSDTAYGNMSGTSMAGPHVVGAVALLWSARPNLARNIEATKQLLMGTANPNVTVPNNAAGCGGIGSIPNNHFGYGRIDILAAYTADAARDQTITFPAIATKALGDPDFSPGATASSGLLVSYSASGNCVIVGELVRLTDAGACTVTASQPGDSYYYPAPDVSQTFQIIVLDDFNRANANKVGGAWVGPGANGGYKIASQKLDVQAGDALYWTGGSFGAGQQASLTFAKVDRRGQHQSLLLKVQGDKYTSGTIAVFYNAPTQKIGVETYEPGKGWKTVAQYGVTLVDGDRLGAIALADGSVQVLVNGNLIGVANAGSFFAGKGGKIGLWFMVSADSLVDDFSGATLPTP